jgi:membrane protein
MQLPHQLELPKRVAQQTLDDEAPELAAGLAYRFLFAIFPFGIFVAALAAFVAQGLGLGDPTDEILASVGDNLPPEVAAQVSPQLQQVLGVARPGLLSFGAILALWAATSGISSLMSAMNKAYDVDETRNFFVKNVRAVLLTLLGSIGLLAAFVTLVGGSVLTEQAIKQLGISEGVWETVSLLRYPVVLALVAVAVGVLFRYGPNVAVSFRWTLIGGLVFAILWVVATVVFGLYVANFANYANTYGALGGVIVLMLWFYLTALLLLIAAETTSVLAKEHEPEKLEARRQVTGESGAAKKAKRAGTTAARKAGQGVGVVAGAAQAMVADATGNDDSKATTPGPKIESTPNPKPTTHVDSEPAKPGSSVAPSLNRPSMPRPADVAAPALVVAKETLEAASGADSRPRLSLGTRAGAFAMLGVAAVAGAIVGLLASDDDEGATT